MASDERIREAVDQAKGLLKSQGIGCAATAADLKAWFETETPFEDSTIDDIIENPLLVVHELVEIDEVRKAGLQITKTTIVDNLEKVDEAHLKATGIELMIAFTQGNKEHIVDRMTSIELWISDPTVTPRQKKKYRQLLVVAKNMATIAPAAGRFFKSTI